MKPHELEPATGSRKASKRVGRGTGSGLNRSAGEDEKGQSVRLGGEVGPGLEGDQMPLYRRLPKRGFTNIFAEQYVSINVDRLNIFENGIEIAPEVLFERKVINKVKDGIKTLGSGALERSLTVKGCKFSKSATEKVEATGGKAEVIQYAIDPA